MVLDNELKCILLILSIINVRLVFFLLFDLIFENKIRFFLFGVLKFFLLTYFGYKNYVIVLLWFLEPFYLIGSVILLSWFLKKLIYFSFFDGVSVIKLKKFYLWFNDGDFLCVAQLELLFFLKNLFSDNFSRLSKWFRFFTRLKWRLNLQP